MTASCRTLRLEKEVWPGRDNSFTLRLDKVALDHTRTPADLTAVFAMQLDIDGFSLSVASGEVDPGIDWWHEDLAMGEVVFRLGEWAEAQGIPAGRYSARLITFDPLNQDGIVWVDGDLTIDIKKAPP